MFGYRKEIDKGNENNFFSDVEPLEGLCAPNTENRIFSPKVGSMIHHHHIPYTHTGPTQENSLRNFEKFD